MRSFILSIFIFLSAQHLISQTNATLRRVDNDEAVTIKDILSEDGDPKPTFLITWSGEWCFPCMNVLNSMGEAAKSGIIKVISVNVDDENWESVKDEGYHNRRWQNTTNLYLDSNLNNSFDSYFATSSAPLTIFFNEGGQINYMNSSFNLRAWWFTNVFGNELIWDSSRELNSFSWNYYENHISEELVNLDDDDMVEALMMIERSIALDKNNENTDTYAALLYLSGQYNKALKMAKESIDLAKEEGDDYEVTNELIQKIIEKM